LTRVSTFAIIVIYHLKIPLQNKYPTARATTSPTIPIIISAVELLSYFPIICSSIVFYLKFILQICINEEQMYDNRLVSCNIWRVDCYYYKYTDSKHSSRFQQVMQNSLSGTFGSLVIDSQRRYVDSQEKFVFSLVQYC
jgi:hypothetical protein